MYNLKVLYAEDNDLIRAQYSKLLKTIFSGVYDCVDGEEAINYYKYYSPDIIILDINMPKKNGLEVAKEIRENDPDTKIVIISSYDDQNTLLNAIPLGLVTYMVKPINLSDMKNTMDRCASSILKKDEKGIVKINEKVSYDFTNSYLCNSSNKVKLTKNEKKLIDFFIKTNYRPVQFDTLFEEIWEEYDYSLNKLRSLVNRLNAKLEEKIVTSEYGVGYRFNNKISML